MNAADQQLRLQPGERALFSSLEQRMEKKSVDTVFYNAWKNNLLAFDNDLLKDVVRKIGRQYSCSIEIADTNLSRMTFTGYIPRNDLNLALNTLIAHKAGLSVKAFTAEMTIAIANVSANC